MAEPTKPEQNTGIIVTQQGVDVAVASDYQKVIDTRWRFLDIAFETEFNMSHSDSGGTHWWAEKVFDHNLGYKPAFQFRLLEFDSGGNSFITPTSGYEIVATEKSIFVRSERFFGDPTTPLVIKGFLRIFSCDISAEYQATIDTAIAGAPVNEPDIGLKILTTGGDINDPELSKFSVNTKGKAFAVQQTGTRTADSTNANTLIIEHDLGYPPTYFLSKLQSASAFRAANPTQSDPIGDDVIYPMVPPSAARARASSFDIQLVGAQSALVGSYAFLITKEPTELAI